VDLSWARTTVTHAVTQDGCREHKLLKQLGTGSKGTGSFGRSAGANESRGFAELGSD